MLLWLERCSFQLSPYKTLNNDFKGVLRSPSCATRWRLPYNQNIQVDFSFILSSEPFDLIYYFVWMLSSIREDQGVKSSFDSAVSKAEQKLQVSGEDGGGGDGYDDCEIELENGLRVV